MRSLQKLPKPEVLERFEQEWLNDYLSDKTSGTKRYRYRHAEIKKQLKSETGFKCVYCESKIGHNTPGDVEHKVPSSIVETKHFDWDNLTIACTECNRRKGDYYNGADEGFLDPYVDEVEEWLEHCGPLVFWKVGHPRAEIAVRILELNSEARAQLIFRKIERLAALVNLIERWNGERNQTLKSLLLMQLQEMTSVQAEYSAMTSEVLKQKEVPIA